MLSEKVIWSEAQISTLIEFGHTTHSSKVLTYVNQIQKHIQFNVV